MSMTSSSDSLDRQEHARTRVELPNSGGKMIFELTTRFRGRSRLRHVLSELHQLPQLSGLFREAELVLINGSEVTGWSHSRVISDFQHHLARITETELKLTLRGRDEEGCKHIVEVTIDALSEDGLGDSVKSVYDFFVRITDKIVTTPDVTDVSFERECYIRVRHGAQTGQFLKVDSDQTLCMDVPSCDSNDYVFKCYFFFGHDQESVGTGDGDREYPRLCVLQEPCSKRFVAACAGSGCLKMDDDSGFRTDIRSITTPDCHFFVLYNSGNGDADQFCLRPLVMHKYFLSYDAVTGLKLKKCVPPPYKNFAKVRFFSFEFVPAQFSA